MVHCCVSGCKSRSERKTENITFHTFPKNDMAVRQLWIQATGRQNWEPTKFTRICSRHFEENCFRKTQNMTFLNAYSVPTLYGPASSGETTSTNVDNLSTVINVTVMDTENYRVPELITPRKKKLLKQLGRQTLLAQTRSRKLVAIFRPQV
ncbi:hypothetical protein ABMA28_003267 [Loxostege sticticalis]|uniref:THAP-type domain-containing protein n=1 Tax=Loxostege sticticalis TaxID=481309 RepID=A0ABD0SVR7_LOXSC